MTEKKTFMLGNPETDDYENDARKLTDGDECDGYDVIPLNPDRNGGYKHKCTSCGKGWMKPYEERWPDERFDCTNCGITVQFERIYVVHIS